MPSPQLESLKAREARCLCSTYGRYPLAVHRARGSRLWDPEGREYVDLLAGIAVTNLGHCPPELTRVMAEQADKLVHVSNLFYQEEQLELAEKLLDTCHAKRAFFCNSGAEANEAAIKLARRWQRTVAGRDAWKVVTLRGSFHGRTLATLTATGQPKVQEHFQPLPPGFVTVDWEDADALDKAVDDTTAGVLVEIVQGEGGVRPMSAEYARAVQRICRERGALFMVDEIQTGMGRTGTMWAFQRHGLEPDVITVAKALANGLPMGAMLATVDAAAGFEPGAHATTFGGGAVLSAVASAVLDALQENSLPQRAAELGARALERFREVQAKHPDKVAEVRGRGLMLGIELTGPAQPAWRALLDRGFVLNVAQERVLRLLPALTIEWEDLENFARALDEVLALA